METRSIFSVNTNQTGFKGTVIPNSNSQAIQLNQIHQFFYRILPTFSRECPYLAKIFYLQLILRQNFLIYTQNRVDARDIWLYLSRMLDLKKPQIYVVDDKINITEVLNTKNQYQRILLYDVSKISTQMINKLLNSQSQISLMGIQSPNINAGSHVSDFFALTLLYNQQQHISHLVETYNQQIQLEVAKNFDKKLFNQCVKVNFQIVLRQNQQQGFLKPFLQYFQFSLDKLKINISQSRWKKMLRILKFIGVNKQQGSFKKMSLADFVLAPELLGSSINQVKAITEVLYQSLIKFIPFYGLQKFQKGVKNHFWFSNINKSFSKKIIDCIKPYSISFFYPCVKFPQTANIKVNKDSSIISYNILGFEKKLMSDHHFQIQPQSKYLLSLDIKSDSKMTVHLGIACYDKLKNIIMPIQACRRQHSEVVYLRMQGDHIHVKNVNNLANWVNEKQNFAYQRAIGIYINGQTQQLLQPSQVLYSKQPYSKTNRPYQNIVLGNSQKDEGEIIVSQDTRQWFVNFRHLLQKNKTVLMNHYEGGVGCIGQSLELLPSNEWQSIKIEYQNSYFKNLGKNFFPTTKYVRIVLMVNYNDGYPHFSIHNKNAVFQFKNVCFKNQSAQV